jgi:aryl-alcohol dehydrogenase-like predicted oxidoreductase
MPHKKDFIVPIPGMWRDERLAENFGAVNVELRENEFSRIEDGLSKIRIHGGR